MKNQLTFIYLIPVLAGMILLFSCGDDNTSGTNNNTTGEVIVDTNISYRVLPGTGGDDIWLNLNPSNNIKIEFKYSITQNININELFLNLIDTTGNFWELDSIKLFSITPQVKSISFNPNNNNKKKIQIHLITENVSNDTVYIKLDNFKVSKLN